MSTTEQEVEAVLLNSEDEPQREIRGAMRAVVRFAILECGATELELESMLERVFKEVQDGL